MDTQTIYKTACDYLSHKPYTRIQLKVSTEMTPAYLKDKGIALEDDELPILGVIHPTLGNNNRQFFLITTKYVRYQNLSRMPPWYCKGIVSFLISYLTGLFMLIDLRTGKIPFTPSINIKISEKGNRACLAYVGNAITLDDKFLGLLVLGGMSSDKNLVNYINGLFEHIRTESNKTTQTEINNSNTTQIQQK